MSAKELGVLLGLGAIWGASFMFIKVGGEELQPFALVEMRLGLAGLVMLIVGASVGVLVAVLVGVSVGVCVSVGILVGVLVTVFVAVSVAVSLGVEVAVLVGV